MSPLLQFPLNTLPSRIETGPAQDTAATDIVHFPPGQEKYLLNGGQKDRKGPSRIKLRSKVKSSQMRELILHDRPPGVTFPRVVYPCLYPIPIPLTKRNIH